MEIKSRDCSLLQFMSATKGNWRNAIFIECPICTQGKGEKCSGYLLTVNSDGSPLIVSANTIRKSTGISPDKDECQALFSRAQFETVFAHWLEWNVDSVNECALSQMVSIPFCEEECNNSY